MRVAGGKKGADHGPGDPRRRTVTRSGTGSAVVGMFFDLERFQRRGAGSAAALFGAGTAATAAAAGNGTAESGEEIDAREGKDDENDERLHDDSPLPGVRPAYVVGKRERVPGWLKRVFRDIRGRRNLTLARMKIIFK